MRSAGESIASVNSELELILMDTLPVLGSMRETSPVSISCCLELNSSYIIPRSASRMP